MHAGGEVQDRDDALVAVGFRVRRDHEGGCRVHDFPESSTALYIHEKLILDDQGTAQESVLIGSQNASVTTLTRNRELGVLLTQADGGAVPIATASATFDSDFRQAPPWSLP